MSIQGTILNIQRFTMHDGPGIRTEFFLKGCPLRCDWCGNPESFNRHIEVGIYKNKCITLEKCGAGSCVDVCHDPSLLIFFDSKLNTITRTEGKDCLECVDACPSEAIRQWGKTMSVEECMQDIRKDKGFYTRSGGGITVSGGEPLLQSEFVLSLFQACHKENIHTCLESSFFTGWGRIEKMLPYTDLFICDIKLMDSHAHKKHTGVDNHKILANLKKLSTTSKELILRIPIIPNINDDMENIQATADFILNQMQNKIKALQLLSFMRLGEEKYQSLGLPYKMRDLKFDRNTFQQRVKSIADYFKQRKVHCLIGTKI